MEFQKICDREGVSKSAKVEMFMARYISVHSKGNPQLRLEPFIGEVKKVCFGCEGKFPNLVKVEFVSGLVAEVCPSCLADYKAKTTVKRVLRT